jgi:isoleucyl-tRNA synthetase
MSEAKAWNFEELENWNVKVGDFVLEEWDFEIVYQAWDSSLEIESWFGMVISMDTNITEELKNEWYVRDIVRHIQESRKEADYQVDDRIEVCISWADSILENFKSYIEWETLSTIMENLDNSDIDKDLQIEDLNINLKLKK